MVFAQKITKLAAMLHLKKFRLIDPDGVATVDDVVSAGDCYLAKPEGVPLVYVLQKIGHDVWVTAAAGKTIAATSVMLAHIETQAATYGARFVKFQTVRAGLARLAERAGYAQSGHVFTKALA